MTSPRPKSPQFVPQLQIEARKPERLPLASLLKFGGVLMLVTATALVGVLTMQTGEKEVATPPKSTESLAADQQLATKNPVSTADLKPTIILVEDHKEIEPLAGNPEFMPPETEGSDDRWQMDLGNWAATETAPSQLPSAPPLDEIAPSTSDNAASDKTDVVIETVQETDIQSAPSQAVEKIETDEIEADPIVLAGLPPVSPTEEIANAPDLIIDEVKRATPIAPATPLKRPPAKPMISIVIDDLGNNAKRVRQLMALRPKPTLAFLPYPSPTPKLAKAASEQGFEIILHMPMQPKGRADPGPEALTVGLSDDLIVERIEAALARVPGAVGLNNHMGSAFTGDRSGMERVLSEVRKRGLVFVDSRTTNRSVVGAAASVNGAAFTTRDIFLDHDPDPASIRRQLAKVEAIALQTGTAVAIGHPYDSTIEALQRWLPEANARGFEFVPVRDVIAWRHCAKQSPSDACDPEIFVAELASQSGELN